MRTYPCSILCLLLLACTPETDLRQEQTAATAAETASGSPSSSEPDPLAGQLVEPPTGSTGIPSNLVVLVVRFMEVVEVAGAVTPFVLRGAAGDELPLQLGLAVPCSQACYQLALGAELSSSSLYTLEAVAGALQFLDGKPVPAGSAGLFTTGQAADRFAPRIEEFTAQVAEGCIAAHLAADEVVRAEITLSAGGRTASLSAGDFSSTMDLALRLPDLPAGVPAQAIVRVVDRAGNAAQSTAILLNLPPLLPRIVITEVLANSAGSESTQEFVEIYNAGSEDVALAGLAIADKAGGDTLPEATLCPGAFALIVPEKYDPAEGSDVPPRDGTLLIPVSGRLAGDGLSNAGEAVRLLSSAGDVVSQYGGWVDVSATAWSGKSVKRSSPDACDAPVAWSATPGPATPGW
jgi:hypothetical protein